MRTTSSFAPRIKRLAQSLSCKQPAPCRRATLKLEALEDRCVPTVFTVTNVNDALPVFGRAGQVVTINGPGARLLAIARSSSPGATAMSMHATCGHLPLD